MEVIAAHNLPPERVESMGHQRTRGPCAGPRVDRRRTAAPGRGSPGNSRQRCRHGRSSRPGTSAVTKFRVLTYNVRALRDDRDALVHVIRSCDADVVCMQEAPRFFRWRARCAALARDCDLVYVNGGGTTGGVALFAHLRVQVEASREGLLSKTPGLHRRAVAAAVVSKSGSRLMVVSTHLGLRAQERKRHAGELLAGLSWVPTPHIVLAGDLNSGPKSEPWLILHQGGLRDPDPRSGPTFPAWEPVKRIDALLISGDVRVTDYRVVTMRGVERATDHRPVLAVLDV